MSLYKRLIQKYLELHRKSALFRRVVFGLAAVTVFVTVYQLIIPSITMTRHKANEMAGISTEEKTVKVLDCGLKVHHHDKSCYKKIDGEKVLICGKTDYVIHEHDDSCYAADEKGKKTLVCELPEIKAHKHDESCYEEETVLVCDKEEREGHEHTDECYEEEEKLVCDKEEHVHDEDCYEEVEDEDGNVTTELVCDKKEHEHDEDCYKTTRNLICDQEEEKGHTHSDKCYETKKVLVCGETAPHKHTQKCYEKGHNDDPEYLICEKLELKEHKHGKKCFVTLKTEEKSDDEKEDAKEEVKEKKEEEEKKDQDKEATLPAEGKEGKAKAQAPETDTVAAKEDDEEVDADKDQNIQDADDEETETAEVEEVVPEDEQEYDDTETEATVIEGTDETSAETQIGDTDQEKEEETEQAGKEDAADDEQDDEDESSVRKIRFSRRLSDTTGIWRRFDDGSWARVKSTTILTRNENLMVRIAYVIPEGTLNEDNAYVEYKLPQNLGATQLTADRINDDENHLNQIVEGSRLPNDEKSGDENLAGKYEMVYNGENENGEDTFRLELQFNDYTIKENASHDVEGWLMFYLKEIALPTDEDGNGKIVFSKKGADGEEVAVSYIVEKVDADEADQEEGEEAESQESETGEEETGETESNIPLGITYPALSFSEKTDTVIVNVQAEEGALPFGTSMIVEDVQDENTLDSITEAAAGDGSSVEVKYIHAVDITFFDKTGREIEPLRPVRVSITCPETDESEGAVVMHMDKEGSVQTVDQVDKEELTETPEDNAVVFDAENFSVYAVVGTTLEKTILTSDGKNYKVTLTYGPDAEIPEGATLEVSEITEGEDKDSEETAIYNEYITKTQDVLDGEEWLDPYIRLFDIKIKDENGEKVEISAPVEVKIELTDRENEEDAQIVHFADSEEDPSVVENVDVEGNSVSFTAEGFSIYGVVLIQKDKDRFVFRDGDYELIVSYTEEAEIPIGTKMTVREIEDGSEKFFELLGRTWQEINKDYLGSLNERGHHEDYMEPDPDLPLINIDMIRFFDITLEKDGETIEPKVPVKVEFQNSSGMTSLNPEGNVAGVVHFAADGKVEFLENIETETNDDAEVVKFEYMQSDFSPTGYYVGQETRDTVVGPTIAAPPSYQKGDGRDLQLRAGEGQTEEGDGDDAQNGADDNDDVDENWIADNTPGEFYSRKLLKNNHDGTYKLALSVKGMGGVSSTTTVNKANVLIVMDRSSSMVDNYVTTPQLTQVSSTNGEGQSPRDFTPTSGVTYYGVQNHNGNPRYFPLTYTLSNGRYVWSCENYSYQQGPFNPTTRLYTNGNNSNNGAIYAGTVQSRLSAEQSALSSLLSELLSKNYPAGTVQDGVKLDDIIEISIISFGNTRFENQNTEVDWTTDYAELMDAVNITNTTSGTNWEEALQYAKEKADSIHTAQPDESVYIVFLTDGEPTAVHGETNGANHYNDTGQGFKYAYSRARNDALALVKAGYELYGIFTFNPGEEQTAYLKRLINFAYGNKTSTTQFNDPDNDQADFNYSLPNDVATNSDFLTQYYTNADSESALQSAFQHILSTISDSLGFESVHVTDGVATDATATAVVNGKANGYRYVVKGPVGELYSVTATGNEENPTVTFKIGTNTYPGTKVGTGSDAYYSCTVGNTEYKMTLASIDNNGMVQWDLSPIGQLLNGYTYTAEFNVWPDQDAYDFVAHLNNHDEGYEWDTSLNTYHNYISGPEADPNKNYEVGGAKHVIDNNNTEYQPSIVRWTDGTFSVLTNTEQKVTYNKVTTHTVDGETTTHTETITDELIPPKPMPLVKTEMDVKKVWDAGLDPEQFKELLYDNELNPSDYTVNLYVWQAETYSELEQLLNKYKGKAETYVRELHEYYKIVNVGYDETIDDFDWSKEFTVAPGLMVTLSHARDNMLMDIKSSNIVTYTHDGQTEEYYVLDPGHYYTLTEPSIDRHYELNTLIYHPMIVDNVLSQVTMEETEDGLVVKDIVNLSELEGTNTLKGGINVRKLVLDEDEENIPTADDTFTVTLKMWDKNGDPYTDFDYRIYYGENNPKYYDEEHYPNQRTGHIFGTAAAVPADNNDDDQDNPEPYEGKRYIANNTDGIVTFELYVGDNLRVINVPTGVTYQVTENTELLDGTSYVHDSATGILYDISINSSENYVPDSPNANGTYTVRGNAAGRATVVNTVPDADLRIRKISFGDPEKPLKGVTFKLYYDEECEHQVTKDSLGNDLGNNGLVMSNDDGIIPIGTLIDGKYYLKEISTSAEFAIPTGVIPITITDGKVSYRQEDYADSYSNGQLIPDSEGVFTIVINNNPAVTLPATGGIGTTIFYLVGGLMIIGALIPLMEKRRRYANTKN